jgi:hypothetical protein
MTTPAAILAPYVAGLPVPQPRRSELDRRLAKTPACPVCAAAEAAPTTPQRSES